MKTIVDIRYLAIFMTVFGLAVSIADENDHHKSDGYWAQVAKLLPAYEVDPQKMRIAQPNEKHQLGFWGETMDWPHIAVSAANLPDGRVLTFASNERTRFPGGRPEFTYAAVWDPATNTFKELNHDSHDMFCAHLVMLENGRVFINGGRNTTPLTSEFDYRNDTWTRLENMTVGRWYPTTTYLSNGDVFTASGNGGPNNAERWTRDQGWIRLTGINWGPIAGAAGFESNWWPYNFLAPNGKIFHAGPTDAMHWVDPTGLGSIETTNLTVPGNTYPKHAAVAMFDEGKIIVAGGAADTGGGSTDAAYILDLNNTNAEVRSTNPMEFPRRFSNPVMLPNGEFLVIGGNTSGQKFNDTGTILTPEVWNPDTGQWRQMSDMAVPRNYHSISLLLTDGRVLAAGGGLCGCSADHQDGEIFSPPYLFNPDGTLATRPEILNAPSVIEYGQSFSVTATPGLNKFSLVKMIATTHALSTDIRYLSLDFTEDNPGEYLVESHDNRNVMTPGYWMLFGLDSQGVPSISSVVLVSAEGNAPPAVIQPGNQFARLGQSIEFTIQSMDPEGSGLFFSAQELPDGFSIDSFSGTISGTAVSAGIYESVITVSDDESNEAQVEFYWTVSSGIICDEFTNIAEIGTASQSSTESGAPAMLASNARDGDTTTYSQTNPGENTAWWEIEWDSEKSLQQVQIFNRLDCCGSRLSDIQVEVLDGNGSSSYASSILNPSNSLSSPEIIEVDFISLTGASVSGKKLRVTRIVNTDGPLNDETSTLAISEVVILGCDAIQSNRPPVIVNPGNQVGKVGDAVSLAIEARDPDGDNVEFDAIGLPNGLVMNRQTGMIQGNLTLAGRFQTTITVNDGNNGSDLVEMLWTISSDQGVLLEYADFSESLDWQLNGDAVIANDILQLTPAANNKVGSAFLNQPIDLSIDPDLSIEFNFRIHGVADGADGMAFIIQGNSPNELGIGGGGLGINGVPNSLSVEIDNYQNGTQDRSANEIAIVQDGLLNAPLVAAAIDPNVFDLESGDVYTMWVDYDSSSQTLLVYLDLSSNGDKPDTPILQVGDLDLDSVTGGLVYIGFSGATGGLNNVHEVQSVSIAQGSATPLQKGTILREWWSNISGNPLSGLRSSPDFPDNPTGSELLDLFEGPVNWADNYGSRISGVLYPPVSGEYVFWVSGDDNTELYLSSDQTPGNATRIGLVPGWTSSRQWTKYPEQKSDPISLIEGKPYYIEALHKEGGGGDNVAVGWEIPGQPLEVIPSSYFRFPDLELEGAGLLGTYFEGAQFDSEMFTRQDESINFNWGTSSPNSTLLGDDQFSVRWTGYLIPEFNETYTFYLRGDDGVRLWLGQNLVIDNWTDQTSATEVQGSLNLEADQPVPVRLEYYEQSGTAEIQWSWSSESLAKQIVAPAFLRQRIKDTNNPPSIQSPGNLLHPLGGSVGFKMSASDPEGDNLTFSADGLPDGISIDEVSGQISGVFTSEGTYNPIITVVDPFRESASVTFEWTITGDLLLNPTVTNPAEVGSLVTFSANFTGGLNPQFQWNPGDGSPISPLSSLAEWSHAYNSPGLYNVTLIARDQTGKELLQTFVQPIHQPLVASGSSSSSTVIMREDKIWNVNPDNKTVTVSQYPMLTVKEIGVGTKPRSLAIDKNGFVWVSNKADYTLSIIDSATESVVQVISLPFASQPHGVVASTAGDQIYVVLEAAGKVLKFDAETREIIGSVDMGRHVRHIAYSSLEQKLYVSRFISPLLPNEDLGLPLTTDNGQDVGGEVIVLSADTLAIENTIVVKPSVDVDSEASSRGIPNYLGALSLSPDGKSAWLPSKQDNVFRGLLRDGNVLTQDNTVRSISSFIDLENGVELPGLRIDHDNGGLASASVVGKFGLFVFAALESSHEVGVIDIYGGFELGKIIVGEAPQGITISEDGMLLVVHNFLSRLVATYDLTQFYKSGNIQDINNRSSIAVVQNELLDPQVLLGKRLFYDSRDIRLAREPYISCASCHNDGAGDGRVWDISSLGEGLRNTINLNGKGGMAHGMLHWSGNFDEVHDFEEQIRHLSGGRGLIPDPIYNSGSVSSSLGDPKAGLSSDLDALAAYVTSLDGFEPSPYRNQDGSLTEKAQLGQQVFIEAQCVNCHSGAEFTDSGQALLHDIGTLGPQSGKRLGALLTGLDTPTLKGLWKTAPYLHDGSASTLLEAVSRHSGVNIIGEDLENLEEYLKQVDDNELTAPGNNPPVIANQEDKTFYIGDAIEYLIVAFDFEGSNLTFEAQGLPTGLTIDGESGIIAGVAAELGAFPIIVVVTDEGGVSTQTDFTWSIEEKELPLAPDKIALDGDLSDWSDTPLSILDPVDVAGENISLDLRELRLDHDENYICIGYVNEGPVDLNWGYILLLDTDLLSNTGYQFYGKGFDFMVNGKDLYSYQGDGDAWSWQFVESIPYGVNGNILEMGFPRSLIGSPESMNILFFGDNGAFGSTGVDLVPNLNTGSSQNSLYSFVDTSEEQSIVIDGNFADWQNITELSRDVRDVTLGRLDWDSFWVSLTDDNLYVSFSSWESYTPTWSENLYIDSDSNSSSGFNLGGLGADFLYQAGNLYRYTGNGDSWSWEKLEDILSARNSTRVEVCIPFQLINSPSVMRFQLVAYNEAYVQGGTEDYLPGDGQGIVFRTDGSSGNVPPVARDVSRTTQSDTPILIELVGQDADLDDLSFELLPGDYQGTATLIGERVFFEPANGSTGVETLFYVARDNEGVSNTAEITINVVGATPIKSNPVNNLSIDGSLMDWGSVPPVLYDSSDVDQAINRVDWRQVWLAHDAQYLYLGAVNDSDFTPGWGVGFYFDMDLDPLTGFSVEGQGADFMVQNNFLFEHTGDGSSWSWDFKEALVSVFDSENLELRIDLASLDLGNDQFAFLAVGENAAYDSGLDKDLAPDSGESWIQYQIANVIQTNVEDASDSPVDLRNDFDYNFTILTSKPTATSDASDITSKIRELFFNLQVKPGHLLIIERSQDLETWEIVYQRTIDELGYMIVDPELRSLPEVGYFRAILVEEEISEVDSAAQ